MLPEMVHFLIVQAYQGIRLSQLLTTVVNEVPASPRSAQDLEELFEIGETAFSCVFKLIEGYGHVIGEITSTSTSKLSDLCMNLLFEELFVLKFQHYAEVFMMKKKAKPSPRMASFPLSWNKCSVNEMKLSSMKSFAKGITASISRYPELRRAIKPMIQTLPWLRKSWMASFQQDSTAEEYSLFFADVVWTSATLFSQIFQNENPLLTLEEFEAHPIQEDLQHSQQHLHRALFFHEQHDSLTASLEFEIAKSYHTLAEKRASNNSSPNVVNSLQHAIQNGITCIQEMSTFSKAELKILIPEMIRRIRSARFIGEVFASMAN